MGSSVVSTSETLERIYGKRFGLDMAFRQKMWRVLCRRFFQRFVPPESTVMEVGAGYCEFINTIQARRKIAVDLNPATAEMAAQGVEVVLTTATDLSAIPDGSIDVAFASNFFEHISRDDILLTMREVARTLRPGGRFLVLQPNIRYCARDFWMFFDHITPLDQHSLTEALEMCGFQPLKTIVRFLPYSTKGKLPKSLFLVRAYLAVPLVWRFLGQQTFVVAERLQDEKPQAGRPV
jgi:ubiquinone/menaquinone biosynthesis C-methylase UbiE